MISIIDVIYYVNNIENMYPAMQYYYIMFVYDWHSFFFLQR